MAYFVIHVDEDRREVDLMPVAGWTPFQDAVPFSQLIDGPVQNRVLSLRENTSTFPN